MSVVSMKALLESGVHFGHRTHRWHPKMKPYIFTQRNNIHIIDLELTLRGLEEAYALIRDIVSEGGNVLFVGTKRQAQETIQLEAERCDMPWVTHRWLGGTMTNWATIRARVNELNRLERMRDSGEFEILSKKEALGETRKIDRLDMLFGGVRDMDGVPDVLFVVDISREETSVHEANILGIPVVAMVDTNCDPSNIDYIIPSNDDAIRAIKLIVGKIADSVIEGKAMRKDEDEEYAAAEVPQVRYEETAEMSDEELLGEATLAKLEATKAAEAEAVAKAKAEAAEKAEADAAAEAEAAEAGTVEADAAEADAAEADAVEADVVEADAVEADAVEAVETEAEEAVDVDQTEEAPAEEAEEANAAEEKSTEDEAK
ncbi:MAG: 30S ribosomal protein S2 [Anaerolineales bacterium]|nr:30S ribosomal protein S2 [Chloroflexota bacterium]MBL6981433.1 30S ribosomal protein S2 [Anaerolineales bacterium]